jgi:hypothetical protein
LAVRGFGLPGERYYVKIAGKQGVIFAEALLFANGNKFSF